MKHRIPATEGMVTRLMEIAKEAAGLIAKIQVLDLEASNLLRNEAISMGLNPDTTAFDFATKEYVLDAEVPDLATEEGRKEIAEAFGADSVELVQG